MIISASPAICNQYSHLFVLFCEILEKATDEQTLPFYTWVGLVDQFKTYSHRNQYFQTCTLLVRPYCSKSREKSQQTWNVGLFEPIIDDTCIVEKVLIRGLSIAFLVASNCYQKV